MKFTSFIVLLICLAVGTASPNPNAFHDSSAAAEELPSIRRFCNGKLDFDCGEGELRTRCISSLWLCDKVFDCSTGLDEINCNHLHTCPSGLFMCQNGDCFPAKKRCNGIKDCLDGSDELACLLMKPTANKSTTNAPANSKQNPSESTEHWHISTMFLCILIISLIAMASFCWAFRRFYRNNAASACFAGNLPIVIGNNNQQRPLILNVFEH